MKDNRPIIIVLGTYDTKAEEHIFLQNAIQQRGLRAVSINVGTGTNCPTQVDYDLHKELSLSGSAGCNSRDKAISEMISMASGLVQRLHKEQGLGGIISAGGGSGTHIASSIMRSLPMGIPKLIVSTVASRDMKPVIDTKDITVMHSVVDLLGINSISGKVLDKAAGAICAMAQSRWEPKETRTQIALTLFGFITPAAEFTRKELEDLGYEVIPFHANGTGGMAMEALAREGYFAAIVDLATHELADELKNGYCSGIGPDRLAPIRSPHPIPRLVIPGGLDCAVLEFTRDTVPAEYKGRKIFFYDFRSAIRLTREETIFIANQIATKLSRAPENYRILIPKYGWSEADKQGAPLFDPELNEVFVKVLRSRLGDTVQIKEVPYHINDPEFGKVAAMMLHDMVQLTSTGPTSAP